MRFLLIAVIIMTSLYAFAEPATGSIKGAGFLSSAKYSGRYEIKIIKTENDLFGHFYFTQVKTPNTPPMNIKMKSITEVTFENKKAIIKGNGFVNETASKITIVAEDLMLPGSSLGVSDKLTINAEDYEGKKYNLNGVVEQGDVAVAVSPAETHHAYGIFRQTNPTNITEYKIDVKSYRAKAGDPFSISGLIMIYVYQSESDKSPERLLFAQKIFSITVNNNKASITAECLYKDKPAIAVITIIDSRKPDDPASVLPDTIELSITADEGDPISIKLKDCGSTFTVD